eukprot:340062_1
MAKCTKPSLVRPDLSDLWSVSWIGGRFNDKQENNLLNDILSVIAILTLTLSWVVGFASPLIVLSLCYLKLYTLSLCVVCMVLYPYVFAFRIKASPAISRFYIKYGCAYFEGGCSMIYEAPPNDLSLPLSQRVPSLVSYHPHGIFTLGLVYNSGIRLRAYSDQSQQLRQTYCGSVYGKDDLAVNCALDDTKLPYFAIIDSKLHCAPIFNHMCVKWTGCMEPAGKGNVSTIMKNKRSYGVMTGGFYEAALYENGKEFVYIKEKKGFIKYALKYGYQIVPCYTFGESRTYSNLMSRLAGKSTLFARVSRWLSDHNMPACVFYGGYPYINPLLPYSKGVGIHSIHAAPIQIPKIESPSQQDIDKYHEIYCTQIKSVFDRNKY